MNLLQKQIVRIKKVMSWNGYPRYIQNKFIKRIENQKNTKNNDTLETTKYCHDFLQNTLCRSARKNIN